MYGIIDYETKWVVCKCHQHRGNKDLYVADYKQFGYVVSKYEDYVSRTTWYAGLVARKEDVLIISEEQYNFLTTECEKIMKAKSMLTITIGALFGNPPKPKMDEEITDVEFENE